MLLITIRFSIIMKVVISKIESYPISKGTLEKIYVFGITNIIFEFFWFKSLVFSGLSRGPLDKNLEVSPRTVLGIFKSNSALPTLTQLTDVQLKLAVLTVGDAMLCGRGLRVGVI